LNFLDHFFNIVNILWHFLHRRNQIAHLIHIVTWIWWLSAPRRVPGWIPIVPIWRILIRFHLRKWVECILMNETKLTTSHCNLPELQCYSFRQFSAKKWRLS
jgi:hypothetical protein